MSEPISTGRMFELTNQTFRQHFDYILILAAIFIALGYIISLAATEIPPNIINKAIFFVMFLLLLIYAKLAIMIHRLVILKERGLALIFKWSFTELKFIAWIIAITTILGLVLFFIIKLNLGHPGQNSGSGFFNLLTIVSVIILGVIFSRYSLIFPATAAGHSLSLGDAWNLSKNHKLLLFILVILVPYVTNRLFKAIPEGQLMWSIVIEVLSVLIIIYEVGLLSHCYDSLIQKNDSDE